MSEIFKNGLLAFIPLFVAIDVLAVVPLFLTFSEGMNDEERKKLITESVITVFAIALVFLFAGRLLFRFLGITDNDFRIGGGVLLLAFAVADLGGARTMRRRKPETTFGIVPLGIPLILGPAALTTILILVDAFGYGLTLASILANLSIVWLTFRYADRVGRILGKAGAQALGRIMSIFLAAIAVMMIRVGLTNIWNDFIP